MKRFTGWVLITFSSILLLIFVFAIIALIPGVLNKNAELQMSAKDIMTSFAGLIIVVSVLIIVLKKGLKKIKTDIPIETTEYLKDLNIELTGKIEYIDYRNLILGLSFKKPIYLIVLGILMLFSISFLNNIEHTNHFDANYLLIILFAIVLLSPVFTVLQIKKLYKSNKIFQEKLNYIITNNSIQITGETVDSTQNWNHFYKVRETKKFFMFYQDKIVATLIDKSMFSDNDLNEFRNFTKSLPIKKIKL